MPQACSKAAMPRHHLRSIIQRARAHCFGRFSAHSGLLPSTRRLLRFSLKPAGLLACGSTSGFPPSRAPVQLASAQWPLKNRTHRSQLRGQLRICAGLDPNAYRIPVSSLVTSRPSARSLGTPVSVKHHNGRRLTSSVIVASPGCGKLFRKRPKAGQIFACRDAFRHCKQIRLLL